MPITSYRTMYVLDCPDAHALADFYARILGWEAVAPQEFEGWVTVTPRAGERAGFELACQQVPNHVAPTWPEGAVPQQGHLDFYVPSIAAAEPEVLAAGATRHDVQPSESGSFVVYLDPAGHPFCLCQEDPPLIGAGS